MGGYGSGRGYGYSTRTTENHVPSIHIRDLRPHEWQSVFPSVRLTWTPCNYGGLRPWFCCCLCDRRYLRLYQCHTLFVCRRCLSLPYASQHEGKEHRAFRRAWKKVRRLGTLESMEDPVRLVLAKPPRMHWRPWLRKLREAETAQDEARELMYHSLCGFLARMEGRRPLRER